MHVGRSSARATAAFRGTGGHVCKVTQFHADCALVFVLARCHLLSLTYTTYNHAAPVTCEIDTSIDISIICIISFNQARTSTHIRLRWYFCGHACVSLKIKTSFWQVLGGPAVWAPNVQKSFFLLSTFSRLKSGSEFSGGGGGSS